MAKPPTPYTHPNAVIAIMAKAPVAGQVKTRMQPQLSPSESATLQANLMAHTVHKCVASQLAPVQLWCSPNTEHPCFLNASPTVDVHPQPAGDLGVRMNHVFEQQTDKTFIIIVGTDCPQLTQHHLKHACETLHNHDTVVLQPATDGGYVLIGGRTTPRCFENIDWGTDQVLQQSLRALNSAHQSYTLLDPLPDLDNYDDLSALPNALRTALLKHHPLAN